MALSLSTRVLQNLRQSHFHQVASPGSLVSIRWRARVKKKWLVEDQKDMSWMEPMLEYRKEKALNESKETEPSQLHVVCRVQPLKGRPWWEKKIMERLGLDGPRNTPVIHKNTPVMNRRLRDVSHLIKIQPLKFPQGFPDDPRDYEHTVLMSNGELIVRKRLEPVSMETVSLETEKKKKWQMELETMHRELKRKLLNYTIHSEFHPAKYTYTRNQDGKEYRYNFNKTKKD